METEPTEPGGFVLEGVRGDYIPGVWACFYVGVRRFGCYGPPCQDPAWLSKPIIKFASSNLV